MEKVNLKTMVREEVGKEAVKKLRHQGLIPAVVYKGKNALNIKMPVKDLMEVIHTKAGENVVVNLQVEGDAKHKGKPPSPATQERGKDATSSKNPSRTTIIKEVQYHPVNGNILHVDFNEISLTEVLTVKVLIAVKGEAAGLKEGGVLEHALWEVEVECLPTQIPENIPVDVSALKIGDSILVKDLQVPSGVKILSDPKATIITLAVPRVEEEEAVKPEEEMAEPEVIMEKKPEEEEVPGEEVKKVKKPESEKEKK